jgi:hypothetical protein
MENPRTLITGNTWPVRTALKALGGTWDPDDHGWYVPDARAEEARGIVAHFNATFEVRWPQGCPPLRVACLWCHAGVSAGDGIPEPRPAYVNPARQPWPPRLYCSAACAAHHRD